MHKNRSSHNPNPRCNPYPQRPSTPLAGPPHSYQKPPNSHNRSYSNQPNTHYYGQLNRKNLGKSRVSLA